MHDRHGSTLCALFKNSDGVSHLSAFANTFGAAAWRKDPHLSSAQQQHHVLLGEHISPTSLQSLKPNCLAVQRCLLKLAAADGYAVCASAA
jgi:hypothetical protein